jgi:signal transduction histidine kinase
LNYDQSVITFKYAALNYLSTEKNRYKYKLDDFDDEWNNVGTRREATYTNLSPGKYTFMVKASNNDGIWNEKPTTIKVIVLPPWWKTLFFRIFIVILVTSLVVGYYFYRISTLQKRQIQLEAMVENRTKEIQAKNTVLARQTDELSESNTLLEERQQMIEEQTEELRSQKEELEKVNENLKELNLTKDKFFSIIAHDLKNPFNTILGFAELLNIKYDTLSEEKKRLFSKAIHESSENVYNLLENLLQWARSQTNRIKFEPVSFNINDLIDENIELLKEVYHKKNISLNVKTSSAYTVFADRNMINTVIRNLLINAAKFTEAKGKSDGRSEKERRPGVAECNGHRYRDV